MPTPVSSGYSYTFYTGDGSTTTFPTNFEVLDSTHIHVTVGGTELDNPDEFSVVNGNAVFVTAPASDADIRVFRVTPKAYDEREVDFRSFGSITEDEMDLNQKQIWFLIQEAMETDDSGAINPNAEYITWDELRGYWSAKRSGVAQRIGSLGTPAESTDAATKGYVDDIAEWGIAGMPQGWQLLTTLATTNYTLPGGELLDPRYLIVALDGVLQTPEVDFTVIQGSPDSTLSFTEASPAAGIQINVQNFGKTRFVNITSVGENAVGSLQIQSGAVGTSELADGAVTEAKIADDAVTADKIRADAVGTTEIADDSVTLAKLSSTGFIAAPGGSYDHVLKINKTTGDLINEPISALDIEDWLTELANLRITQLAAPNTTLNMSGQRIVSVGAPSTSTDAATKGYVDGIVGSGIGEKIDQLYDATPGVSGTTWALFSTPPSWWTDSTYLYYTFVFSNWRWVGSGRVYVGFYQSGTWREDARFDNVLAPHADTPVSWQCRVTNPRTGAVRPSAFCQHGTTWASSGTGTLYGSANGIRFRGETSNINSDARVQVYGHRALS